MTITPDWTTFGLRGMPSMSARQGMDQTPPFFQAMFDAINASVAQPLRGITTDGTLIDGLFRLGATGRGTAPITDAAHAFLGTLDAEHRSRAVFPLEATEKRMWFNIHPNVFRHGVMLEDLSVAQREAGLGVLRASLSARGFTQARDIMRLNGLLVEITGRDADFGEWPYFLSFYGEPSAERPWAWQIDGHHLSLNCVVIGDQFVFTPSFMGSEPCKVTSGPLAGVEVMGPEQHAGLAFMRSLNDDQARAATLYPSIAPDVLPRELQDLVDGRMQVGAFKDNAVIPYTGVAATGLSDAQRSLLRTLIGTYVGWARDEHAAVTMEAIDAHIDETWFVWMGSTGDDGPFYYRVHNPVVLIEFDHHPGVVFDNTMPGPHHIHSILRTPNGGDYGVDLLRQHHAQFDHSHGRHDPRS